MTYNDYDTHTNRYICKICGARSPRGIGYAVTNDHADYNFPEPAADCPNFHFGDKVVF